MEVAIPSPPKPRLRAGTRLGRTVRGSLRRVRAAYWATANRFLRWRGVDAASRALLDCHTARRPGLLRALGAHIGEGVSIHSPFILQNARADFSDLAIGSGAYLGPGVLIDLAAAVSVGPRVAVSAKVSLVSHMDVGPSRLAVPYPPVTGPVSIAADAYLGAGATLLHGVRVGEMAVVGAGAVVRGSVPARMLAAGVPARICGPIRDGGPPA